MVNIALAFADEMDTANLEGMTGMAVEAAAEWAKDLHHKFCMFNYCCGALFIAIGSLQILWKFLLYLCSVTKKTDEYKDGLWGRNGFYSCITTAIAQSSPFSWRCVNASISLMCLLGTLFSIYGAYRILKKWCGKFCSDGSDSTDIESGGLKMSNKKADLWLPSLGEWNSHEEPEMIMDCGSIIHMLIPTLTFYAYYVPYIFIFPAFQCVLELLDWYYHRVLHPGYTKHHALTKVI